MKKLLSRICVAAGMFVAVAGMAIAGQSALSASDNGPKKAKGDVVIESDFLNNALVSTNTSSQWKLNKGNASYAGKYSGHGYELDYGTNSACTGYIETNASYTLRENTDYTFCASVSSKNGKAFTFQIKFDGNVVYEESVSSVWDTYKNIEFKYTPDVTSTGKFSLAITKSGGSDEYYISYFSVAEGWEEYIPDEYNEYDMPWNGETANFDDFKVEDTNGDGFTWAVDGDNFVATANSDYDTAQDEWLFTPGLKFEAGKSYSINVDASIDKYVWNGKFDLALGKERKAKSMSTLTSTSLDYNNDVETVSYVYDCEETGTYFLGIHATGDNMLQTVTVNSISVAEKPWEAPINDAPWYSQFNKDLDKEGYTTVNAASTKWEKKDGYAQCTNVPGDYITTAFDSWLFTPGLNMKEGCAYELKFKAFNTYANQAAFANHKFEVKCGNEASVNGMTSELLAEQEADVVKQYAKNYSCDLFTCEETGVYYFGFHVYGNAGGSFGVYALEVQEVDLTAGNPKAPVVTYIVNEEGNVVLSWEPVTENEYNYGITPDRYVVSKYNNEYSYYQQIATVEPTEEGTLSYTYEPENAEFAQFEVYAISGWYYGETATTEKIVCGPAVENFHETRPKDEWGSYTTSYPWDIQVKGMSLYGNTINSEANAWCYYNMNGDATPVEFTSVNIAVTEDSPMFSMMVYNYAGYETTYDVYVREVGTADFVQVNKNTIYANKLADYNKWGNLLVDLGEYAGKTVQVRFVATIPAAADAEFGDIKIATIHPAALEVETIEDMEKTAGQYHNLTVTVKNTGDLAVPAQSYRGYVVRVNEDGEDEVVDGTTGYYEVAPGASENLWFGWNTSVLEEIDADYYVQVVWGDGEETLSEPFHITTSYSKYEPVGKITYRGYSNVDEDENEVLTATLFWGTVSKHNFDAEIATVSDEETETPAPAEGGEVADPNDPVEPVVYEDGGDFLGYNVYQNGEKVNGWETVKENTFTLNGLSRDEVHKVAVTAVYANGESAPVFADVTIMTGVEAVAFDGAAEGVLYNINGTRVAGGKLVPGIYVTVKNGKAYKIMVK